MRTARGPRIYRGHGEYLSVEQKQSLPSPSKGGFSYLQARSPAAQPRLAGPLTRGGACAQARRANSGHAQRAALATTGAGSENAGLPAPLPAVQGAQP